MTTRAIDSRTAAGIGLAGVTLGIVATLGTGFASWGNVGARVEAVEEQVEKKADASEMRELRQDIREIRVRVDQVLDRLGGRRP